MQECHIRKRVKIQERQDRVTSQELQEKSRVTIQELQLMSGMSSVKGD